MLHSRDAGIRRTEPEGKCGHSCSRALKLAVNYLRERYQDPVDLEDLSALTGLNRFALVHAFTIDSGFLPCVPDPDSDRAGPLLLEGGVPPS